MYVGRAADANSLLRFDAKQLHTRRVWRPTSGTISSPASAHVVITLKAYSNIQCESKKNQYTKNLYP